MQAKRRTGWVSSILEIGMTVMFAVSAGAFAAAQWVVGVAAFVSLLLLARAAEA